MATVRFAKIVAKCGEPEAHLILLDPGKDRALQTAIKADRVLTVFQDSVGNRADHGTVGFHPGKERQYLIFPKSLRAFAGMDVIGIKYDLLATTEEAPKKERAPAQRVAKEFPKETTPSKPQNSAKPKAPPKAQPPPKPKTLSKPKPPPKTKAVKPPHQPTQKEIIPFKPVENEPESDEIIELKKQVKHAMEVLEQGKQVAAFNLLKRIVESR